jgi:release factor glutamine methyltransferase
VERQAEWQVSKIRNENQLCLRMTIQVATERLFTALQAIYDEREAGNITELVLEKITGWSKIDRILNKQVRLSAAMKESFERYEAALQLHQPVQYVLGESWFMGMKFFVNPAVLIPRPETEELVTWVMQHVNSSSMENPFSILDVGTGSGIIAIALKKKIPDTYINACDISTEALAVAERNANEHNVNVCFTPCDFLDAQQQGLLPVVDVIVSNPPYIPLDERSTLANNVSDHEPALALFVEKDPLQFYRAIGEFGKTHLKPEGCLFVETHELYGNKVSDLFKEQGYKKVELKKDMQGKDRMVKALT